MSAVNALQGNSLEERPYRHDEMWHDEMRHDEMRQNGNRTRDGAPRRSTNEASA